MHGKIPDFFYLLFSLLIWIIRVLPYVSVDINLKVFLFTMNDEIYDLPPIFTFL